VSDVKALWEKAVEFHGHSCPGLAMGVVVSNIVLEELGNRVKRNDLVAIVETVSCPVDGIQALLGCTFRKKNLIHKDSGKLVFTFYNRQTKRAIRISRNENAVRRDPKLPKDRQDQIDTILQRGRDLFTVEEVNVSPSDLV
jgi:formylmethanofuran dehydrogenase subunit E